MKSNWTNFKQDRRKRAARRGSEWVFFRSGDEAYRDPWAGREIKIVRSRRDVRGRMHYWAECTQRHMIPPTARLTPKIRRVKFSELF